MLQGQVPVILPQWVGRDVCDINCMAEMGRRPAGPDVRSDFRAVDRFAIAFWKAWSRSMPELLAIGVKQKDRGEQFRISGRFNRQQVPAKHGFETFARGEFEGDLALPMPKRILQLKRKSHSILRYVADLRLLAGN